MNCSSVVSQSTAPSIERKPRRNSYGLLTSFEIRTGDSSDDSSYYTFEDEEIRRENGIEGFSSNTNRNRGG